MWKRILAFWLGITGAVMAPQIHGDEPSWPRFRGPAGSGVAAEDDDLSILDDEDDLLESDDLEEATKEEGEGDADKTMVADSADSEPEETVDISSEDSK